MFFYCFSLNVQLFVHHTLFHIVISYSVFISSIKLYYLTILYFPYLFLQPQGLSSVLCNPSSSASLHPCHDHNSPPGPNAEESCNPTIGEDNTCVFKLQVLDDVPLLKLPGKRLTKKPFKFCSPFKYGIMSRPPPFLELSLRMHAFLCADDSPLKRFLLIPFSIYRALSSIFVNSQ